MAAADLRAACARALANFCAQSGLIRSVVMTAGELADIDVVLRLDGKEGESSGPLIVPEKDESEEEDDMADVALASGCADG